MYHAVEKITGFILILLFLLFSFGCDLQNGENGGETGTETIEVKVGVDKISSGGTAIDFGEVIEGDESVMIELKVENSGEESLEISSKAVCSDTDNFTCSTFNETTEETVSLGQYEFAKLKVQFIPSSVGEHEADISFIYGNEKEFTCSVAGTCVGDGHLEIVDTYTTTLQAEVSELVNDSTALMPEGNKNVYVSVTTAVGDKTTFQMMDFNEGTQTMTPHPAFPFSNSDYGHVYDPRIDIAYNQEFLYYHDHDSFFALSRDTDTGALSFERKIDGNGSPVHAWMTSTHPSKPFVYLEQDDNPRILVYNNLELSGWPDFTLDDYGLFENSGGISDDGNFMFLLRYQDQWELASFSIDQETGELTLADSCTDQVLDGIFGSYFVAEGGFIYFTTNANDSLIGSDADINTIMYNLYVFTWDAASGEIDFYKKLNVNLPEMSIPSNVTSEWITTYVPPDGKNIYMIYEQSVEDGSTDRYYSYLFSYRIDKESFELQEIASPDQIELSTFQGQFSKDGKYFILFGPEEDKPVTDTSKLKVQIAERSF